MKARGRQQQIVVAACLFTAVEKQSREDTSTKTKPLLPGAELHGGAVDESPATNDGVVEGGVSHQFCRQSVDTRRRAKAVLS